MCWDNSKCIYLIRCALSAGAESSCPCNGTNCAGVMRNVCEENGLYPYPFKGNDSSMVTTLLSVESNVAKIQRQPGL